MGASGAVVFSKLNKQTSSEFDSPWVAHSYDLCATSMQKAK